MDNDLCFVLVTVLLVNPCSTLFTNSCHPVVPAGWVESNDLEGSWNQVLSSENKNDGYNYCVSMSLDPIQSHSSAPGLHFEITFYNPKSKEENITKCLDTFTESNYGTFMMSDIDDHNNLQANRSQNNRKFRFEHKVLDFPNFIILHIDRKLLVVFTCEPIDGRVKQQEVFVFSRHFSITDTDMKVVHSVMKQNGLSETKLNNCFSRSGHYSYARSLRREPFGTLSLGYNDYKPDQQVVYGLCLSLATEINEVYNCLVAYYQKFNQN